MCQVENALQNITCSAGYKLNGFIANDLYRAHDYGVGGDCDAALHASDDIESPSLEDNCYMEDEGKFSACSCAQHEFV